MGIFNDNSQNNNTGGSGQPGLPGQKGDPGIGFKLTADGNFDLDNKQMKNLSGGTDKSDAVNYGQLLEHTENHQNNYHLQPSFKVYRNFGNEAIVPQSNTIKIDSNHNHHGLNWIVKEGSDSGFGGQAWVSLKMTNNLAAGVYTAVFETFSAIYNIFTGGITQLNDETLLQQVHGDDNYKIITFSHDYQTTHSKAVIQFTSNGKAGEITFQIRFYGSNDINLALNFFFFSRVITGRHNTAFDHALFDVDDVQLTNQILYFEDVNLNGNKIKNIAQPTEDEDGANKKYVDDEIAKLPHSDNGTLKLDGSRAMTGTLDLGGQRVVNIKGFVEDDSTQASVDAQFYDVVHWGTIHKIRADLERYINAVSYQAFNRDDPDPMEDPINMDNHRILNLADPVNNSDASNKKYIDNETSKLLPLDGSKVMSGNLNLNGNSITNVKDPTSSDNDYAANVNYVNKTIDDKLKHSIQSSNTNNAFQYVMDDPAGQFFDEDDIRGEGKTNKDFHKVNKETYEMKLLLDSSGYYSSRLGINMYTLPNGEYTLVFELYYPNSIDSSTVNINALSSVETVSKVATNVFSDHSRTVVHLHKYNNVAPNRLMIDMELKNKTGISYANELTIFVIVYGLSGYFNNVETSVWERLFEVTNNGIKLESTFDMNKHDIKNVDNLSMNKLIDMNMGQIKDLGDGNENGDAFNVKQLNNVESNMGKYIKAEITKVDTSLKKYFNDHLNNVIAERGYQNSLICVFYLDNNQFNNGDKIANLSDKKSFIPIHDANQSVESRKPTADNDLNFSYIFFSVRECLTVNYNLNGKNNLNVFIVFRNFHPRVYVINGLFGNDNGGNDKDIALMENYDHKELRISYGNGFLDLSSFPSKANPLTLNFSVLSVHYNTPDENDSLVYCNGKYVINFTGGTSTGQNTFSIGSISSDPTKYAYPKHIAYFSLYHGRFSTIDIKRQHKYLCERYKIDHDPISIP